MAKYLCSDTMVQKGLVGRYDRTRCHNCGCILTDSNRVNGTNVLCKSCKKAIDSDYKRQRRYDIHDSYREDEKKRAKKYYSSTGREKRDDRFGKYKTPCIKCGEERLYCIEFHHIDPSTKDFNIGLGTPKNKDESLIAIEVKKCVCLCRNCHKEFHHIYGNKMKNPRAKLELYINS